MKKKKISLPIQILTALLLGIAVGALLGSTGLKDITTDFIKAHGVYAVKNEAEPGF